MLHGPRNYVEIAYINYKNLRYTLNKSTKKIDGWVLVPSPMLSLVIFSGSLNICWNFPRQSPRCTGQETRSIDEENCFLYQVDRVTRLEPLADWPEEYFSG